MLISSPPPCRGPQVHRQDPGLRGQAVDLDAKFSPTLMNTAVFLITSLSSVVTFGNNYQGWPWMSSLAGAPAPTPAPSSM